MYIELFLLDNLLMDLLILRLAAAMLSLRLSRMRMLLSSFLAACYAAVCAGVFPALLSPLPKLVSGLVFALALPFKGFRGYLYAAGALFLSALTIGGAAFAVALTGGGSLEGGVLRCGISLRTALIGAVAASCLPRLIRRTLARRTRNDAFAALEIELADGSRIECAALVDTGCTLAEPVSGLPVILLNKRRYFSLSHAARVPVPMRTAAGNGIIRAIKPKSVMLNGMPVEAYVAFADAAIPIVPAMLAAPGTLDTTKATETEAALKFGTVIKSETASSTRTEETPESRMNAERNAAERYAEVFEGNPNTKDGSNGPSCDMIKNMSGRKV